MSLSRRSLSMPPAIQRARTAPRKLTSTIRALEPWKYRKLLHQGKNEKNGIAEAIPFLSCPTMFSYREAPLSSSFFETYLILLNCVQCLSDICVVRLAAHVSFIGKTACGVLLNKKMPARRRAQRQDASWIRRYKSLPLQNRHQVRHHLDLFILKNIRETTLVTVKEAVEQSTVFKKKVTKVFINSKNTMAVLDINKFKRTWK